MTSPRLTTLPCARRFILATSLSAMGLPVNAWSTPGHASFCPCPLPPRCFHRYCTHLRIGRALADKNIAEWVATLLRLRRDGKHACAGLCSDIDLLRRSHKVVVGIDDVGSGQLVAVPLEDSLDGELANLHTKRRIPFEQVARCTAERAWDRFAPFWRIPMPDQGTPHLWPLQTSGRDRRSMRPNPAGSFSDRGPDIFLQSCGTCHSIRTPGHEVEA